MVVWCCICLLLSASSPDDIVRLFEAQSVRAPASSIHLKSSNDEHLHDDHGHENHNSDDDEDVHEENFNVIDL